MPMMGRQGRRAIYYGQRLPVQKERQSANAVPLHRSDQSACG